MAGRADVNRAVFAVAALGTFVGWGIILPYGESITRVSLAVVSTSYLACVWAVIDIPRDDLVLIAKVLVVATISYVLLAALAVGLSGIIAPRLPVRRGVSLFGQAFGTVLLATLPVLGGRTLWRWIDERPGGAREEGTPEERVLSDRESEEFERIR